MKEPYWHNNDIRGGLGQPNHRAQIPLPDYLDLNLGRPVEEFAPEDSVVFDADALSFP